MGPDPNTVAEYLDNTLAGERVPEFEKLCLDSDIDLAEVAACHQILTMVLAQPAEIDTEMKQHMYEVVNHSMPTERKAEATPEHIAGVPDELWVKPKRRKPEVPDYLREGPTVSKWKTYAAAAILLVIVVGAAMVAWGPLDRTHPVARLLGFGQGVENPQAAPEASAKPETGTEAKAGVAAEKSAADKNGPAAEQSSATESTERSANGSTTGFAANATAAPNTTTAGNTTGEGTSAASGKANEEKPVANQADNNPSAATPSVTTPSTVTSNPAASDAAASAGVAAPNATSENVPAAAPNANAPAMDRGAPTNANVPPPLPTPAAGNVPVTPPQGMDNRPVPGDMSKPTPDLPNNGGGNGGAVPATNEAGAPPVPPAASVPSVPVGRLVPSKETVLLKYDAGSSSWIRVPSGKAVMSNEPLLVLPTYRPTITLSSGLTLQIPAETLLELESPDARGIPTVKVSYGRLVVLTSGTAVRSWVWIWVASAGWCRLWMLMQI